jgi:ribosomal protein S18 acetylase RimI-like enzyme
VTVRVRREGDALAALASYGEVPIAFEASLAYGVVAAPDGLRLRPVVCDPPIRKDYDAIPGNHPREWPLRREPGRWSVFSAWAQAERVGGAVLVAGEPGGPAALLDLRVAPERRREGIGRALLEAARDAAAAAGASRLDAETQNVNLAACRFYAGRGFELRSIDRMGYPDLPGEAKLIWSLPLAS